MYEDANGNGEMSKKQSQNEGIRASLRIKRKPLVRQSGALRSERSSSRPDKITKEDGMSDVARRSRGKTGGQAFNVSQCTEAWQQSSAVPARSTVRRTSFPAAEEEQQKKGMQDCQCSPKDADQRDNDKPIQQQITLDRREAEKGPKNPAEDVRGESGV